MAKTKTSGQKKRRGGGIRTTVRAIFTAIQKYPKSQGASVREIYKLVSKSDPGRSKRSISSVKLAIARAVQTGSIRAPKGWPGFRGIPQETKAGRAKDGRGKKSTGKKHHGRSSRRQNHQKKRNRKMSGKRSPTPKTSGEVRTTAEGSRSLSSPGAKTRESKSRNFRQGTRSLSRGRPKSLNRGGVRSRSQAIRGRGKKRQGRKMTKKPGGKARRACKSNNANASTNYSDGDDEANDDENPANLCPNVCVVS